MLERYIEISKTFTKDPEFTKGDWKTNMLGLLKDPKVPLSDVANFLGVPNDDRSRLVARFLAGAFANELIGLSLDPEVNSHFNTGWDNALFPNGISITVLAGADNVLKRARRKRPPRYQLAAIEYGQALCNYAAAVHPASDAKEYQESVRTLFSTYLEAATYGYQAESRAAQKHQPNIIGLTHEEAHKLFEDDLRTTLIAIFENLK